MRIAKLWPLAVGLALVLLFVSLERTPPVRASFMLDGLIDCGRSSGQQCSFGDTLVLLTRDSGAPTKYTINISWLKPSDLDDFEQDDQVKIEIEKLPDGTLMALRIITTDNDGIRNPGTRGAKSTTTTTTTDDGDTVSCVDDITTIVTGTTASITTITVTDTGTITATQTITETETFVDDALDPSVERELLARVLGDGRLGDGARLPAMQVLQVCQTGTTTASGILVITSTAVTTDLVTVTLTVTSTVTVADDPASFPLDGFALTN